MSEFFSFLFGGLLGFGIAMICGIYWDKFLIFLIKHNLGEDKKTRDATKKDVVERERKNKELKKEIRQIINKEADK